MYPSLTYCSNAHLIIDLLMWPFFSNEVAVFKLIEIAQKCTRVFCILYSNSLQSRFGLTLGWLGSISFMPRPGPPY